MLIKSWGDALHRTIWSSTARLLAAVLASRSDVCWKSGLSRTAALFVFYSISKTLLSCTSINKFRKQKWMGSSNLPRSANVKWIILYWWRLIPWAESVLRSQKTLGYDKSTTSVMKPEGSSPYLQQSTTLTNRTIELSLKIFHFVRFRYFKNVVTARYCINKHRNLLIRQTLSITN
jgi:hypothetical protein